MIIIIVLVIAFILWSVFKHHHVKGYTNTGLEIQPIGRVDNLYYNPPFRIIKTDDRTPIELFQSYSQNTFRCVSCGKVIVEHK